MLNLLYVSRSTLHELTALEEVAKIVKLSVAHNGEHQITGALIFTGTHFAQALEGRRDEVEKLMASIQRDSRHRNVTTVSSEPVNRQRFRLWSMAYSGQATYVAKPIEALFESRIQPQHDRLVAHLYELMDELVALDA